MIQQILCASFLKELLTGTHSFAASGGDTFKIALYASTATLNSTTTAYTSTGEVTGSGYTAGGATLTNVEPASSGTTGYTSFAAVTWASSAITARGALIYNSSESNKAVMVLDFGMDRSSESNTFTITFPTANAQQAIIRLTA
jgi:hypothetical protein